MSAVRSFSKGLGTALRSRKLAVVLWLASFVLSLPTLLPMHLLFQSKLSKRPGAAALLTDFDFGVLREMVQYDETNVYALFGYGVLAALILGAIANAFLAGGIYETVTAAQTASPAATDKPTRFFARFFGSAGRYFLRGLGLLAIHLVTAGITIAVASFFLRKLVKPLEHSLSVFRSWAHMLVPVLVAGLLFVYFGLILDFARAKLVREDSRNVFKLWWRSFLFTSRRFPTAMGIWILFALGTLIAGAVFVALAQRLPRTRGSMIFAGFLLGQILTLIRALLKISLVGAQVEFLAKADPPAAPPPASDAAATAVVAPSAPLEIAG